jgi:LPPG:FO 2-phospho-L-lactate transferase
MPRIIALSGGIGGSKLIQGLMAAGESDSLFVVANTGDDFEHLGLHVSPDIDTVIYTSTGRVNLDTGWGLAGESWSFMAMLAALGGPTWFNLGDGDLALHVLRSYRLSQGESLSAITADYCRAFGVPFRLEPMSDDPVRTWVETPHGMLAMQNYFVEARCQPKALSMQYRGAERARPNPALVTALGDPALEGIVLCPSNPFLSIGPILALPGLRERMLASRAPILAVSPIVGGQAIKGPTAKMMGELGLEVSAAAVAHHYRGLIDSFVLDQRDEGEADAIRAMGIRTLVADTVMRDLPAKTALARAVLGFLRS